MGVKDGEVFSLIVSSRFSWHVLPQGVVRSTTFRFPIAFRWLLFFPGGFWMFAVLLRGLLDACWCNHPPKSAAESSRPQRFILLICWVSEFRRFVLPIHLVFVILPIRSCRLVGASGILGHLIWRCQPKMCIIYFGTLGNTFSFYIGCSDWHHEVFLLPIERRISGPLGFIVPQ